MKCWGSSFSLHLNQWVAKANLHNVVLIGLCQIMWFVIFFIAAIIGQSEQIKPDSICILM